MHFDASHPKQPGNSWGYRQVIRGSCHPLASAHALCIISLLVASLPFSHSIVHPDDIAGLAALRQALTLQDGVWPADPCAAESQSSTMDIQCTTDDRVTFIKLQGQDIVGKLPGADFKLRSLQRFDVFNTSISGGLDPGFGADGSLPNLNSIRLQDNFGLNGTLPVEWADGRFSSSLTTLRLDNQAFEGELPDAWGEPGAFDALRRLCIRCTSACPFGGPSGLTGLIPMTWGLPDSFPVLEALELQGNSLSGTVPWSLQFSKRNQQPLQLAVLRQQGQRMCVHIDNIKEQAVVPFLGDYNGLITAEKVPAQKDVTLSDQYDLPEKTCVDASGTVHTRNREQTRSLLLEVIRLGHAWAAHARKVYRRTNVCSAAWCQPVPSFFYERVDGRIEAFLGSCDLSEVMGLRDTLGIAVGLDDTANCSGVPMPERVNLNYCTWPGVTCAPGTFDVTHIAITTESNSSYDSILYPGATSSWPLSLPSNSTAVAMPLLKSLTVDRQLWGSLPVNWGQAMGSYRQLEEVKLNHSSNWLGGLPAEWGVTPDEQAPRFPDLKKLVVYTSISSCLPSEWGRSSSLFPSLSHLQITNTPAFDYSLHGLACTLPDSWGTASSFPMLTDLVIEGLQLRGSAPSSWNTCLAVDADREGDCPNEETELVCDSFESLERLVLPSKALCGSINAAPSVTLVRGGVVQVPSREVECRDNRFETYILEDCQAAEPESLRTMKILLKSSDRAVQHSLAAGPLSVATSLAIGGLSSHTRIGGHSFQGLPRMKGVLFWTPSSLEAPECGPNTSAPNAYASIQKAFKLKEVFSQQLGGLLLNTLTVHCGDEVGGPSSSRYIEVPPHAIASHFIAEYDYVDAEVLPPAIKTARRLLADIQRESMISESQLCDSIISDGVHPGSALKATFSFMKQYWTRMRSSALGVSPDRFYFNAPDTVTGLPDMIDMGDVGSYMPELVSSDYITIRSCKERTGKAIVIFSVFASLAVAFLIIVAVCYLNLCSCFNRSHKPPLISISSKSSSSSRPKDRLSHCYSPDDEARDSVGLAMFVRQASRSSKLMADDASSSTSSKSRMIKSFKRVTRMASTSDSLVTVDPGSGGGGKKMSKGWAWVPCGAPSSKGFVAGELCEKEVRKAAVPWNHEAIGRLMDPKYLKTTDESMLSALVSPGLVGVHPAKLLRSATHMLFEKDPFSIAWTEPIHIQVLHSFLAYAGCTDIVNHSKHAGDLETSLLVAANEGKGASKTTTSLYKPGFNFERHTLRLTVILLNRRYFEQLFQAHYVPLAPVQALPIKEDSELVVDAEKRSHDIDELSDLLSLPHMVPTTGESSTTGSFPLSERKSSNNVRTGSKTLNVSPPCIEDTLTMRRSLPLTTKLATNDELLPDDQDGPDSNRRIRSHSLSPANTTVWPDHVASPDIMLRDSMLRYSGSAASETGRQWSYPRPLSVSQLDADVLTRAGVTPDTPNIPERIPEAWDLAGQFTAGPVVLCRSFSWPYSEALVDLDFGARERSAANIWAPLVVPTSTAGQENLTSFTPQPVLRVRHRQCIADTLMLLHYRMRNYGSACDLTSGTNPGPTHALQTAGQNLKHASDDVSYLSLGQMDNTLSQEPVPDAAETYSGPLNSNQTHLSLNLGDAQPEQPPVRRLSNITRVHMSGGHDTLDSGSMGSTSEAAAAVAREWCAKRDGSTSTIQHDSSGVIGSQSAPASVVPRSLFGILSRIVNRSSLKSASSPSEHQAGGSTSLRNRIKSRYTAFTQSARVRVHNGRSHHSAHSHEDENHAPLTAEVYSLAADGVEEAALWSGNVPAHLSASQSARLTPLRSASPVQGLYGPPQQVTQPVGYVAISTLQEAMGSERQHDATTNIVHSDSLLVEGTLESFNSGFQVRDMLVGTGAMRQIQPHIFQPPDVISINEGFYNNQVERSSSMSYQYGHDLEPEDYQQDPYHFEPSRPPQYDPQTTTYASFQAPTRPTARSSRVQSVQGGQIYAVLEAIAEISECGSQFAYERLVKDNDPAEVLKTLLDHMADGQRSRMTDTMSYQSDVRCDAPEHSDVGGPVRDSVSQLTDFELLPSNITNEAAFVAPGEGCWNAPRIDSDNDFLRWNPGSNAVDTSSALQPQTEAFKSGLQSRTGEGLPGSSEFSPYFETVSSLPDSLGSRSRPDSGPYPLSIITPNTSGIYPRPSGSISPREPSPLGRAASDVKSGVLSLDSYGIPTSADSEKADGTSLKGQSSCESTGKVEDSLLHTLVRHATRTGNVTEAKAKKMELSELIPYYQPQRADLDLDIDPGALKMKTLLGRGAFGAVYHGIWIARDGAKHPVAIKFLDPLQASSFSQDNMAKSYKQFEDELKIMSRVHHPNIVKCYGGCLSSTHKCIVLEYMNGGSLDAYVHTHRKKKRNTVSETLQIVLQVAKGLAYLHPTVVHRDLKPCNALLDHTGCVKLADFGISCMKTGTYVEATNMLGTAAYTGPEVFENRNVNEKCDVYALGILTWETLTGTVPWPRCEAVHIMHQVMRNKRPAIPSSCPTKVASLIEKCWASDPCARLSCSEVAKRAHLLLVSGALTRAELNSVVTVTSPPNLSHAPLPSHARLSSLHLSHLQNPIQRVHSNHVISTPSNASTISATLPTPPLVYPESPAVAPSTNKQLPVASTSSKALYRPSHAGSSACTPTPQSSQAMWQVSAPVRRGGAFNGIQLGMGMCPGSDTQQTASGMNSASPFNFAPEPSAALKSTSDLQKQASWVPTAPARRNGVFNIPLGLGITPGGAIDPIQSTESPHDHEPTTTNPLIYSAPESPSKHWGNTLPNTSHVSKGILSADPSTAHSQPQGALTDLSLPSRESAAFVSYRGDSDTPILASGVIPASICSTVSDTQPRKSASPPQLSPSQSFNCPPHLTSSPAMPPPPDHAPLSALFSALPVSSQSKEAAIAQQTSSQDVHAAEGSTHEWEDALNSAYRMLPPVPLGLNYPYTPEADDPDTTDTLTLPCPIQLHLPSTSEHTTPDATMHGVP